jgi:23S rRNA (cytosine1962-C5)-methyltransferase
VDTAAGELNMDLVRFDSDPIVLRLNRDLARTIKRGHPWVFADALRDLPRAVAGSSAVLLDNRKGQPIAVGFYDPASPLAFRVCDTDGRAKLDQRWAQGRLRDALSLRRSLFDSKTTGFRLANGEGDSVPGLVIDIYGEAAVVKLDGAGPCGFWQTDGIADWLSRAASVSCVYERRKERGREGRPLIGTEPVDPVTFLENGLLFTSDIVRGQKTGFFLDQRDNRHTIRRLAHGRSLLNLFAYTGGFSVAAGVGGASQVTTVDLAQPAIDAARLHWRLNELDDAAHDAIAVDAFEYLDDATAKRRRWDIVVVDPPSFAPNQDSVTKAKAAYQTLIAGGARCTASGGLLAAASCSSHIDLSAFLAICEEGISEARRRGTVLAIQGQPADHPSPLALPEFRYLKFVLIRID